jgi:tetratricopeptide (TPR) repeat protein
MDFMEMLAGLTLFVYRVSKYWPLRKQRLQLQIHCICMLLDVYLFLQREDDFVVWVQVYLEKYRDLYGGVPPGRDGAVYMARKAEWGTLLWLNGRSEAGLELVEQARSWFQSNPPDMDKVWVAGLFNFASTLGKLKQNEAALFWLQEAARLREQLYGADSYEMAQCHGNLGVVYQQLGRWEDAERQGREALRLHIKHTGENSTEAIAALSNLAEALALAGKPDEAEPLASRAVSLSQCNPEMLSYLSDTLASIYEAQGKDKEALLARRRAMDMSHAQGRVSSVIEFGHKQVGLLMKLGKNEEASRLQQHLEELQRHKHFDYQCAEGVGR